MINIPTTNVNNTKRKYPFSKYTNNNEEDENYRNLKKTVLDLKQNIIGKKNDEVIQENQTKNFLHSSQVVNSTKSDIPSTNQLIIPVTSMDKSPQNSKINTVKSKTLDNPFKKLD